MPANPEAIVEDALSNVPRHTLRQVLNALPNVADAGTVFRTAGERLLASSPDQLPLPFLTTT